MRLFCLEFPCVMDIVLVSVGMYSDQDLAVDFCCIINCAVVERVHPEI